MDSKFFKFLVFVLIIIIALVVSSNSDKQEVTLVKTSDELTKILDIKGLVIIDIRNSDEFKEVIFQMLSIFHIMNLKVDLNIV